jgi:hypothetical protein
MSGNTPNEIKSMLFLGVRKRVHVRWKFAPRRIRFDVFSVRQRPLTTNRLPNAYQQHAPRKHAVGIVQVQHADTGLQAVEAVARPAR